MESHYQDALDQQRFALSFQNRRLEDEYRYSTYVNERNRLRIQLLLGGLFILGVTIVDYFLMPYEFFAFSARTRSLVMAPTVIGMLTLSYLSNSQRSMDIAGISLGLSVGLGSLYIGLFAEQFSAPPIFSGYFVVTVYIYFFLGLRTWVASLTACSLVISYFLVVLNFADNVETTIIYNGMFLVFLNLLCIVGAYQFEATRRFAFLKECMLKIRANSDGMTGLSNRAAFDLRLPELWQESIDRGSQLSLLIIDIDFFKQYNDHYGHQKGDAAIKAVAKVLKTTVKRPNDLVCRYGGEEFSIVFFDADFEHAERAAKKLCENITALNIPHEGSEILNCLSISVGVSSVSPRESKRTMNGFIQSADEALYSAKSNGRNQIVVHYADDCHHEETGVFTATQWPAA